MRPTPDPFRGSCRPTTAMQAENMRKFAVTVVSDAGGTCLYDVAVATFASKLVMTMSPRGEAEVHLDNAIRDGLLEVVTPDEDKNLRTIGVTDAGRALIA